MKTKSKSTVKKSKQKISKITLGAEQDIAIISALHSRLKKCAMKKLDVNLHAEKVVKVDASTLQLLLSFIRQVNNNGNTVSWQAPSQELLDSARQIGLQEALLLQPVNTGFA